MSAAPPRSPNKESESHFWWLREDDRILGPYTGSQMLAFLLKGRLKADSLVRPDTETAWREASEDAAFAQYFGKSMVQGAPGGEPGRMPFRHRMPNFVIMAEGGACSDKRIEAALGGLGSLYRLMPHIWLLHCSLQVEKIRTYLVRQLAEIGRLFIIDVPNGIYAFHQFDEDLEDHIGDLLKPRDEATD